MTNLDRILKSRDITVLTKAKKAYQALLHEEFLLAEQYIERPGKESGWAR